MKIAIIGSGAIGGVFANKLQAAGYSVTFFSREKESTIECILYSKGKIFYEKIANERDNITSRYYDITIIAVKIYDLQATIDEYNTILDNTTYILPIQSYINYPSINWGYNYPKVYPTAIMFGAFGKPNSLITYFSDGFICIGNLNPASDPNILKNILENVCKVFITNDIMFQMYIKVLVNASIVPFCIEKFCSFKVALNTEEKISSASSIFYEGICLAKAIFPNDNALLPNNHKINTINNTTDTYTIIQKLVANYPDVVPSIVFDVLKQKPTEMPYIFDDIINLGHKHNIELPMISNIRNTTKRLITKVTNDRGKGSR